MDYLYKWPEAEPLKDESAHGVASFLFRMICRYVFTEGSSIFISINRYGTPRCIISDQGVNHLNKELFHLTKMHHKISSAYHP